jgi:hypothetical protein
MHPRVRQALLDSIESEEFHAYAPPGGFIALIDAILDDLRLPKDTTSALVTDGAVAALATVCHTLCEPGTNFVTTDPGWKWPLQFARDRGAEIREIPIYGPEQNYRLSAKQLADAVDAKTRIIYLVDPNNPLGICYTPDEIREFCEIASPARLHVPRFCRSSHAGGDYRSGTCADDLQLLEMAGSRRAACWGGGCEQDADQQAGEQVDRHTRQQRHCPTCRHGRA